jgi:hypothetical protein
MLVQVARIQRFLWGEREREAREKEKGVQEK